MLDSGRDDGVTEACCEGLSRMGAKVAVTFVGNELEARAAMAGQLVEKICQTGGMVAAVGGIPHRMKSRSEQPADVRFVEELVDRALHDLGENHFDIIGKFHSFLTIPPCRSRLSVFLSTFPFFYDEVWPRFVWLSLSIILSILDHRLSDHSSRLKRFTEQEAI